MNIVEIGAAISSFIRSWTTRGVVIASAVIVIVLLILFSDAKAQGVDPNPVYLGQSQHGFHFNVSGEGWLCAPAGEGKVDCVTQNGNIWECSFAEQPVYFTDCRQPVGI